MNDQQIAQFVFAQAFIFWMQTRGIEPSQLTFAHRQAASAYAFEMVQAHQLTRMELEFGKQFKP
jgi:hypothetical protein